ncbi:hypothetical protein, partial [Salmonella enterica]|uniref:hypothetical protein n=1 Tax=Salmonella enterica TaxID=28901 RepID=UPI0035255B25
MDYSLLLGVHRKIIGLRTNNRASGSVFSGEEDALNESSVMQDLNRFRQIEALAGSVAHEFYFGMIDYLQEYDWKKKAEKFIKTKLMFWQSEVDEMGYTGISCT